MTTRKRSKNVVDARTKALLCARQAINYKAQDLVLLDVAEISSFADYFIICSGRSSRQVQGLADHLEESFLKLGDRTLIDGTLNGLAGLPQRTAGVMGRLQTGHLHFYALLALAGLLGALAWGWQHG